MKCCNTNNKFNLLEANFELKEFKSRKLNCLIDVILLKINYRRNTKFEAIQRLNQSTSNRLFENLLTNNLRVLNRCINVESLDQI